MKLPDLYLYNSLSRQKERFEPQTEGRVGLYLCGPTVYGHAHLGHARPAIVFDVVVRYLQARGYQVRYVRNVTDVGHLEADADEGEDKIAKLARLQKLEPMEVAQQYTNSYRESMSRLGCRPPSIEPLASGHIIEQIAMIEKIMAEGMAYEVNGSVYFDVPAYHAKTGKYGELSGRVLEDLLAGTRDLSSQEEKRNPADFALWKQAEPRHIMRWPSPWSEGFPGWHIECSAMSAKYLGTRFDIHGGGMDLLFPHHEGEIAQSTACNGHGPARYWMHNNMIQVNGQKMGKSLGNFINLEEFFDGTHALLEQAYSPMTIRFFVLQAHYRSTVDFGNEALKAAGKGMHRLLNGLLVLDRLPAHPGSEGANPSEQVEKETHAECLAVHEALSDDFNTAMAIAALFNLLKRIHALGQKPENLSLYSTETYDLLTTTYRQMVQDVLGLQMEEPAVSPLRQGMLEVYKQAREAKDWPRVDDLRKTFAEAGLAVQDGKLGSQWVLVE